MQIPHSTFLQALGCAIINSLWQFALLWLLYFLVNTFFKLASKQKYSVAVLLQCIGFVWFAGTFIFYYQQWDYISDTSVYLNDYYATQFTESSLKERWLMWIINIQHFVPYLSIAYLILLAFLSFKWLQSYFYTKHIQQTGLSKINVDWRLFVQKLSEQLGLQRKVSIYLSSIVKAPLTIGFFKPVILVPLASINHLSTEQMEAVILHELAHIKRFDYLVNLVLTLIEAIMFFNPFMQLLSKHIKRERENSCDDWVLQYEYNAATYAGALLKIALLQAPSQPCFAMNAAENNKDVLLIRVKRMIEKREKSFHYKHQLIALLFTTLTLSFIAWFTPANNNHVVVKPGRATPPTNAPGITKIDNPLFNPVFFFAETQKEIAVQRKEAAANERKLVKHSPHLAIPDKGDILKLDKISSPIIIRSASVHNKMEVVPGIFLVIDSLFQRIKLKKLYTPVGIARTDRNQLELERTISNILQTNVAARQASDKGKIVLETMKHALVELKAKHQKLQKLSQLSKAASITYDLDDDTFDGVRETFEQENLQALVEQINEQLRELQQEYYSAKAVDFVRTYTAAAVPAAPSAHSYSFEYSDKPRERIITSTSLPARVFSSGGTKSRVHSSTQDTISIECNVISPTQPVKPVKKAAIIIKRPIVHI